MPRLGGQVSWRTLARTQQKPDEQRVTTLAANKPLAILYGCDGLAPDLWRLGTLGRRMVWFLVWGWGPWDGLVEFKMNDQPFLDVIEQGGDGYSTTGLLRQAIGDVHAAHYNGEQNAPDPDLVAMLGVTAPEVLAQMVYAGLVYSVVSSTPEASTGLPQWFGVWRGRRLYDHRDPAQSVADPTTWQYSTNAQLALADFRRSSVYGVGRDIDWASSDTNADACDEPLGDGRRREVNLLLTRSARLDEVSETLRAYAGCWVLDDGITSRFVPDRPAATAWYWSHDDADPAHHLQSVEPLQFAGPEDVPTLVTVAWKDPDDNWSEKFATVYAPGAKEGDVERREEPVPMWGLHDESAATRTAIELLNKRMLCDATTRVMAFDSAARVTPGDVVALTFPSGLAAMRFRVEETGGALGDHEVALRLYSDAAYSDEVVTKIPPLETDLPDPAAPPAPASITVVERNFVSDVNSFQTRFEVSWPAPDWPWPVDFSVTFSAPGVPAVERVTRQRSAVSDQVVEGLYYDVSVVTRSGSLLSAPRVVQALATGKAVRPSDVPWIKVFETGGEVRITIGPAVDADLTLYEARYDDGSLTYPSSSWEAIWAAAKFIDTCVPSPGGGFISSFLVPPGEWRILVCARDKRSYSEVPTTASVTVTLDLDAMLVGDHEFANPTVTGMTEFSLPCDAHRYFVTSAGASFADLFPNAMSTYTNPLFRYHAAVTSRFETEAVDFGLSLAGTWQAEVSAQALSGTAATTILLSDDAVTYVDQGGASVKANARFGKVAVQASGSATLLVSLPDARLRVDARAAVDDIDVTSSSSGAIVVSIPRRVAKFKSFGYASFAGAIVKWRVNNLVTGENPHVDLDVFDAVTNQRIADVGVLSVRSV